MSNTRKLLQISALLGNFAQGFPGQQHAGQALSESASSGIRAEIEKEEEKKRKARAWYKPKNLLATAVEVGGQFFGAAGGAAGGAIGAKLRGQDVGQGAIRGGIGGAIKGASGAMADIKADEAQVNSLIEDQAREGLTPTPSGAQGGSTARPNVSPTKQPQFTGETEETTNWLTNARAAEQQAAATAPAPKPTPWRDFGSRFINELAGKIEQQAATQQNDYAMKVDPKAAIGMDSRSYQAMQDSYMARQAQMKKDMQFEQQRADELKLAKMKMQNDNAQAELERAHKEAMLEKEYMLKGQHAETEGNVQVDVAERTGETGVRKATADYYTAGAAQTEKETEALPTSEEARKQIAADLEHTQAQTGQARASAGASEASAERYRRETENMPTSEEARQERDLGRSSTQADIDYKKRLTENVGKGGEKAEESEQISAKDRASLIANEKKNILDAQPKYGEGAKTAISEEEAEALATKRVDGRIGRTGEATAGSTPAGPSMPPRELTRDVYDELEKTLQEGQEVQMLMRGQPVIVRKVGGKIKVVGGAPNAIR